MRAGLQHFDNLLDDGGLEKGLLQFGVAREHANDAQQAQLLLGRGPLHPQLLHEPLVRQQLEQHAEAAGLETVRARILQEERV